jgi:hypothetical protein
MVQVLSTQLKSGKIVRLPMVFPWVDEVAGTHLVQTVPTYYYQQHSPAMRETFIVEVVP